MGHEGVANIIFRFDRQHRPLDPFTVSVSFRLKKYVADWGQVRDRVRTQSCISDSALVAWLHEAQRDGHQPACPTHSPSHL